MTQRMKNIFKMIGGFVIVVIGYSISTHNYLLFHALAEGLSVFISFTVFIIAYNSKAYLKDGYLLIIGIAYLFIGFLDFLHTLSFKGMAIFTDYDFYANQLWIGARFFESSVILLSMYFVGKNRMISAHKLILVYGFVTAGIIYSIYFSDIFPVCFVLNEGQTTFKIVSEYIIIFILGISLLTVINKRTLFERYIARLLILSIFMTILSELAFTFYVDNYGLSNLIGHYFKIISFYCIYQAIVVTGIRNPYDLIFKQLSDTNSEMKRLNEQLALSVEHSKQAYQSKSMYLSVISHEMRTPLNGILGFTQMLRRTNPTAEQQEYIEEVIYSANVLRQSIDNILDTEKFKNNKMQYFEMEQPLKRLFIDRILFYQTLCKEKGLLFESEIRIEPEQKVMLDSEKIEQLLNNLISNAVKFTDKGTVTLNASCEEAVDQVHLKFSVADTGTGISEKDQKRLFEPFTQVGDYKNTKYGGSGLGLFICKEIVNHYEGEISVESKLFGGTTFFISLKLEKANVN